MSLHRETATMREHSAGASAPKGILIPSRGDTLGARFVLRDILGHGASGTVFSAIDTSVGQKVAIKILHPHLRDLRTQERLRREVRASRPGHPNAVTVYDLHETDGHIYLSLELVEGQSLRDLLVTTENLDAEQVITAGSQIAAALEHLHNRGVIHRDVKPGNVLIAHDGTAKLCDMGLARPLEEGVTVTETEMVVGTPVYMAPEQAVGHLIFASDIYALGLTLYRCLTGEVPLTESSALATLNRRQHQRPPSVRRNRPSCPRWLDRLLLRMLEPLPRDRPSATEVRTAFTKRRLLPKPRRNTIIFTLAVLFLAAMGATGAHFAIQRPTDKVEIGRTNIAGRDQNGKITWQKEFKIPVDFDHRIDLNADGSDEYILGLQQLAGNLSRKNNSPGPEIYIFDQSGREWTHFIPKNEVEWPFQYGIELAAYAKALDIDHDGRLELVLVCNHKHFYPSVTFIYWPEQARWDQVLSHSGHLYDVASMPNNEGAGFRFLAVNNRLGVLPFVGQINFQPKPQKALRLEIQSSLKTPPDGPLTENPRFSWNAYVPLDLVLDSMTLNQIFGIRQEEQPNSTEPVLQPLLDGFFNPTGGPNEGRNLVMQRKHFMDYLNTFTPMSQPVDPQAVLALREKGLEDFESLFVEDPYRIMFDISTSHALARSGSSTMARAILEETTLDISCADCVYQLAHLDALAGHMDKSIEGIESLGGIDWHSTRALFDGPQLLLRIGIETRNQEAIDVAISNLNSMGSTESGMTDISSSLKARVRFWWDESQPQDLSVGSYGYAPAGEAIACLARWRQGQGSASDVTAMLDFIDRNPDAKAEGRLAYAAALITDGDPGKSILLLSTLDEELRMPEHTDFSCRQLRHLAQALRVVAIEASGDLEQARSAATDVHKELTPNLLPAILVEEVLERIHP